MLGQPTIALWKEKQLVVAYQKGIAGKHDMGSIDAIVSSNDGDSWSIPSTIFDHDAAARGDAVRLLQSPCLIVRPHPDMFGEESLCHALPLNYADVSERGLACVAAA